MIESIFELSQRVEKIEEEIYLRNKRYALAAQERTSKETKDIFEAAMVALKKIEKVLEETKAGEKTIARACEDNGIPYTRFLRSVKVLACFEGISGHTKIDEYKELSGIEKLYSDVFGVCADDVINTMPDDADETIEWVIKTLTPREEKVLKLRYGIEKDCRVSLEEVGNELNVTKERVRQIELKAIRKLRHKSRAEKLLLGKGAFAQAESEYEKEKAKRIEEYRDRFLMCDKQLVKQNREAEKGNREIVENGTILDLDLSVRSYNCLWRAGIRTLKDLSELSREDLLKIRNLGRSCADEIEKSLKALAFFWWKETKNELQRADFRSARRSGGGQGCRMGYSHLHEQSYRRGGRRDRAG